MNINNGKTGNVNIPGTLHSTGGDGDGQVGGVVAYAGDVYDETLGKNQKEINQILLDGSADSNVIAVALNDLNEKVEEQEKVTSSGLNDLNDKTDNLSKDIESLERVTSSSLNDLDEKIDDLSDKVDSNELATTSALTDLNDKIKNIAQSANNISFDDSITQLGTQESPIDNVQAAINQLTIGMQGFTGRLVVRLLYGNSSPITNKEVSITVNWRGTSYDISSQYSPSTQGFKTDSNGYIINNNNNEYLILPLGATYTIHFYDISVNYITPEDKTGIIDANSKTINCVYDNASYNEMVYVFVQMPNVSPSIVTTNNKILYIYYYDNSNVSYLQYKCLLRDNGTIKQILNSDDTQATFNGNNLISANNPVLIPVPIGTKYTCSLQEWDETIPSTQQEYVKSTDQTFIASKIKRTVMCKYINVQLGIFLVVEDSTKSIGYRECIVTNQDIENNKITFKDGESTYYAYLNNSSLYKDLVGSNTPILWEENIIGYGIRTSILVSSDNNDSDTYNTYPNCCFFVPTNIQFQSGKMLSNDVNITLDNSDKGGLYLTKSLAALSADQNSPICQALINNNSKAITLNIPNQNTRIIQGFVPTRFQIDALRSNYNIINTIHKILTGNNYHKTTGTTTNRIWSSSLVSSTDNHFFYFDNNINFTTPNPSNTSGTNTGYAAFVFYPF